MRHFENPFPTPHLIERLRKRNITWAEVVDILDKPDVVYGPDPQGRRTMQKNDLCVVVSDKGAVITVLLRQDEQWNDEEVRQRIK